ncbi:hypothetical protein MYSEV_227 [Mythimna separata entomopoxvirus 'L']|uniref:Uncharacterized protein n=1 Tax=Mythimna separata entomopoxvirus 'L' TaxID=1293572 RepID=A0A916P218_9POXV|nr:hypothetical protein MYSEV_227 [Mythimna separata entomopoxvirus 'L']CCU56425.1 hypothetical protein MYSEV_227 [Mythimna separata entomopoxvirus 'L']
MDCIKPYNENYRFDIQDDKDIKNNCKCEEYIARYNFIIMFLTIVIITLVVLIFGLLFYINY